MHARHVTVKGSPERIDEGIRSVREQVIPVLQGCDGFKGQLLLVDRERGEAIGISLWDSEENMRASEEKVHQARQSTADQIEASTAPEVRLYELPVFELP
jgi:heme-degrading monooxygenase HmoA